MPSADRMPPATTPGPATNSRNKKPNPDEQMSGAWGCLAPAFFLHVLGTAFVLTPLNWSAAGLTMNGIGALLAFVSVGGVGFQRFPRDSRAYKKARLAASLLIWYGLAAFAASLAVLVGDERGSTLTCAVFSVVLPLCGVWVRGSLMGRNRMIPPRLANVLTVLVPLLLVADGVAYMTYPGVTMAAILLSLTAIAFLAVSMACNTYRTPILLNGALLVVAVAFLLTGAHRPSTNAIWLGITGEPVTCRFLAVEREPDSASYTYLCPGEVLTYTAPSSDLGRPEGDRLVRDGTRLTTALLDPGQVTARNAALWIVHFGAIVVLLLSVLLLALRPRTP
ncbi:hypothetical protein ACFY4C_07525 [Actinomadura viridis]|uniref:hypothetical protein n=1 Tax=Actinomadura viridis TaxID=58110 RepID=UPI0036CE3685